MSKIKEKDSVEKSPRGVFLVLQRLTKRKKLSKRSKEPGWRRRGIKYRQERGKRLRRNTRQAQAQRRTSQSPMRKTEQNIHQVYLSLEYGGA